MKRTIPFLVIALLLAAFAAPFASSLPDGLEKIAQTLGFDHFAWEDPVVKSPFSDYKVKYLGDSPVSTSLAGVIGTLLCFFLPFSLYLLRKK